MEWIEPFADTPNHPAGLITLFLAACVEYVFPPFPGDTVTLFGAVLVGHWSWSFFLVFSVVTMGSVVGAAVDFFFGAKIHAWRRGKDSRADKAVNRILRGFRRWGIWFIAVNRFMPGIRAFFFVAAGMAEFSFWPVMGLALLSAALWNLLVVGVGTLIGSNFDTLSSFLGKYQLAAWSLVVFAVLAGFVIYFKRRGKRTSQT